MTSTQLTDILTKPNPNKEEVSFALSVLGNFTLSELKSTLSIHGINSIFLEHLMEMISALEEQEANIKATENSFALEADAEPQVTPATEPDDVFAP